MIPSQTHTPTGTLITPTVPSITPTLSLTPTTTNTGTTTPAQLLPDLAIDMVRIELQQISCLSPGNPLGVRVFFTNIGQAASGSFVVNVNGATQTSSGLPPNGGQAFFFAGAGNPVTVTLDSTNLVTESNESNNTFSEMVAEPTAPLPCTVTPTP
jgi:subtilase family serine protease